MVRLPSGLWVIVFRSARTLLRPADMEQLFSDEKRSMELVKSLNVLECLDYLHFKNESVGFKKVL